VSNQDLARVRVGQVSDLGSDLSSELVITKAKYGILDDNTYNFDETGFIMGQISTGAVVTASERQGRPKQV
jgi:hypothetical protein